jgi:hypothetical protein
MPSNGLESGNSNSPVASFTSTTRSSIPRLRLFLPSNSPNQFGGGAECAEKRIGSGAAKAALSTDKSDISIFFVHLPSGKIRRKQ